MTPDVQSIVIGVSSGIGGALATIASMMLGLRSLSGRVTMLSVSVSKIEEDTKVSIKSVCDKLDTKLDKSACEGCHHDLRRELDRGYSEFEGLYESQKATAAAIGEMGTAIKLLAQKVDAFEKTLSKITRIEVLVKP